MCWEYAHVASSYLYYLHLSRCTSWESNDFRPETTKTKRVICGLKNRKLLGRRREGVYVNTVLQRNNDPCARKPDSVDRGAEFEGYCNLLLVVIPDNYLTRTVSVLQHDARLLREAYRPCSAEI